MELARSVVSGETSHTIFYPRLAERFEYDIQIMDSSGIPELNRARKLSVRIQEGGNVLEFKENKVSDTTLLSNIIEEYPKCNSSDRIVFLL
jgi:hypothetical protein